MSSGDWVNGMLTGVWRLGSSDALCNGLLNQRTKMFATKELRLANTKLGGRLNPKWFPELIESSGVVGRVRISKHPCWNPVTKLLRGWRVVAFLGDNQATAAGCGTADYNTIVISAGTSGTVNRPCSPDAPLRGNALCFDYWKDRLLLLMLTKCGSWYEIFRKNLAFDEDYEELNKRAIEADFAQIRHVRPPPDHTQSPPANFHWPELEGLGTPECLATIQSSIALELLQRTKTMLQEVKEKERSVDRFVLTGGLIRAPLVRQVLYTGLQKLVPNARIFLNNRRGPLAHKSDALGAVFNAMMAEHCTDVATIVSRYCDLKPCAPPSDNTMRRLSHFIDDSL
jgi:sugar (pentulose or hexulose) kinase